MDIAPSGDRIVYAVATPKDSPEVIQQYLEMRQPRAADLILLESCQIKGLATSGSGVQQVTSDDFFDVYPAFTPQGDKPLFSSNRRGLGRSDLLRINAGGRSGISNICVEHRDALCLRPTQAADGTIAFGVHPTGGGGGTSQVWTVGGENEFPTQIMKGLQPAISPDGKRIAYIGEKGDLWVSDGNGTNQTQLTFEAKRIAEDYRKSLDARETDLLAGFARNDIPTIIRPYSYPSWSSDGRHIVYTGMEGNDPTGRPNEDVWIMKPDGSDKQQLTTNGSVDRYPLVSPEGDSESDSGSE